mmetsp:Transcript_3343/g.8221  ORF Transcript_3343/g.8221 Transcript_3343/m.8221 type:complete len:402 (-) Transcript_3343:3661-4866(-)
MIEPTGSDPGPDGGAPKLGGNCGVCCPSCGDSWAELGCDVDGSPDEGSEWDTNGTADENPPPPDAAATGWRAPGCPWSPSCTDAHAAKCGDSPSATLGLPVSAAEAVAATVVSGTLPVKSGTAGGVAPLVVGGVTFAFAAACFARRASRLACACASFSAAAAAAAAAAATRAASFSFAALAALAAAASCSFRRRSSSTCFLLRSSSRFFFASAFFFESSSFLACASAMRRFCSSRRSFSCSSTRRRRRSSSRCRASSSSSRFRSAASARSRFSSSRARRCSSSRRFFSFTMRSSCFIFSRSTAACLRFFSCSSASSSSRCTMSTSASIFSCSLRWRSSRSCTARPHRWYRKTALIPCVRGSTRAREHTFRKISTRSATFLFTILAWWSIWSACHLKYLEKA